MSRWIVHRLKDSVRHIKSTHDYVPLCAPLVGNTFLAPHRWVERRGAAVEDLPLCGVCRQRAERIARDAGVIA